MGSQTARHLPGLTFTSLTKIKKWKASYHCSGSYLCYLPFSLAGLENFHYDYWNKFNKKSHKWKSPPGYFEYEIQTVRLHNRSERGIPENQMNKYCSIYFLNSHVSEKSHNFSSSQENNHLHLHQNQDQRRSPEW